ncbi:OPT family oligopeptide transporter [candidate division KSB1 bacterium]
MTEPRGLPPEAYEAVPHQDYKPYVAPEKSPAELTVKAIILGAVLGIVFAAANAAVGLRVGLTISASIPVAVMSVAVFRIWSRADGKPTSILETNMSQTIGSAGESLAAGVIFTIPAFFLWGMDITVIKIFTIACIGGLLGVLFMIPLRRYLIRDEHGKLPYPEGTACAEVLVAGDVGGTQARTVFIGLGVGALYTLLMKGLRLWKLDSVYRLPFFRNAEVSLDVAPALLGVGYILGYRISTYMVGGSIISWLALIPIISIIGQSLPGPIPPSTELISQMGPGEIWSNYIRYIGAGAVVFGGLATLVRAIPTIFRSVGLGLGEFSRLTGRRAGTESTVRTNRDLPLSIVLLGSLVLVVLVAALPQVPVGLAGALLIVVFAFFFTTVSSRIVGLIGSSSNPISGMTIATLMATSLIFVLAGWGGTSGKVAALSVGAVVCMAAAIAGDTSQDLKTGFLLGATPRRQQIGEFIGVLTSAMVIGWTLLLLHKVYVIGTAGLPAPQAWIMSSVVDGIFSGNLPWELIFIGIAFGMVMEILGLPSLALAVGMYLPLATMATVFVGGLSRSLVEKLSRSDNLKENRERGILFASGLVGGEGIVTVIIALVLLAMSRRPDQIGVGFAWMGTWADLVSLLVFAGLAAVLIRASFRSNR